jgi:hypothetical protein
MIVVHSVGFKYSMLDVSNYTLGTLKSMTIVHTMCNKTKSTIQNWQFEPHLLTTR